MPTISGYHHLNLTVTDLTRSVNWYCDVLGFDRMREFQGQGFTRAFVRHPDSQMYLGFTCHGAKGSADAFSEFRTGMDHMAFTVPGSTDVDHWKRRFAELEVDHSEVKASAGALITLRDPDNIQLEIYAPNL